MKMQHNWAILSSMLGVFFLAASYLATSIWLAMSSVALCILGVLFLYVPDAPKIEPEKVEENAANNE